MKRQVFLPVFAAFVGALVLGSCRDAGERDIHVSDPFAFAELRRRAAPIRTLGNSATANNVTIRALRGEAPEVARLYRDALSRFDGIYGEGVGPAKRSPEYLSCIDTFHAVNAAIAAPTRLSLVDPDPLWAQLKACRERAVRWTGPAEIATFGTDVEAMTDGAMLALSFSVTAAGMPQGPRMYQQLPPARPRNY